MDSYRGSVALRVVSESACSTGIAVKLTFPGRRYHATPWGHHVNEGLIEWPPSPWRVLRALLATGYAKLQWPAEAPPDDATGLIEKLSRVLPSYRLPRAVGTHSRHYMPLARFKNGREDTTLVLDTWARIDDDWLGIHWDVELSETERTLLAVLVRNLGYLGRSESWVEGELVADTPSEEFPVTPGAQRPGSNWEQVALLAPESAEKYALWRENCLGRDRAALPTENAKGKALSKAQMAKQVASLEASYPEDLVTCLQADTRWLQDLGWSQPPGTRKVFYWRPSDALSTGPALVRRSPSKTPSVEFILLALAAESNNLGDLPATTRTLPQGELLHRAIISKFPEGGAPQVLSGQDSSGKPLKLGHRHAHILHLDLDGDEHLDHVLLWAPMGFDEDAQRAVRKVRYELAKKAKRPHRLAVAAMGNREALLRMTSSARSDLARRLQRIIGEKTGAKEWVSVTPFVPARFLKASGKNSLAAQIRTELATRGLPSAVDIEVLEPNRGNDSADCDLARQGRHFVRTRTQVRRRTGGPSPAPPIDCGFMVRLRFENELKGPLVLGYGCHLGLGCFGSQRSTSTPRQLGERS